MPCPNLWPFHKIQGEGRSNTADFQGLLWHCPELVKGGADSDGFHVSSQGVTYCGESSASSLTMANVPWHEEVVRFVQDLADLVPGYEIACEHEHSNCLLIAHTKVRLCQGVRPGTGSSPWKCCSVALFQHIFSRELAECFFWGKKPSVAGIAGSCGSCCGQQW